MIEALYLLMVFTFTEKSSRHLRNNVFLEASEDKKGAIGSIEMPSSAVPRVNLSSSRSVWLGWSRLPARSSPMPSTNPTRAAKQSSLAVAISSSNICQAVVRSLDTGPRISAFQLTYGRALVLCAPLFRHHAAKVEPCHYTRSALSDSTMQGQILTSFVHVSNSRTLFSTHASWQSSSPGQDLGNPLLLRRTHHTPAECNFPRPTSILQRT